MPSSDISKRYSLSSYSTNLYSTPCRFFIVFSYLLYIILRKRLNVKNFFKKIDISILLILKDKIYLSFCHTFERFDLLYCEPAHLNLLRLPQDQILGV